MNKVNNRLLSIFLVIGILFFLVTIYMFVTKEILPPGYNQSNHTVNLDHIKFIKNDFRDQKALTSLRHAEEIITHNNGNERESCNLLLVNTTDNETYARSAEFSLKMVDPPETIEFYNNSFIPQSTLHDDYKLVLQCNERTVVEFVVKNVYENLQLKNKDHNLTERKEIKLTSVDNKITLFLVLTVDQSL